jgi:hypothetical protein
MQTELHTAEPLVPKTNSLNVKIAIEKMKGNKSVGNDQIPSELIQTDGSEIHILLNSVWSKELPQQCKKSSAVPTYKRANETVFISSF